MNNTVRIYGDSISIEDKNGIKSIWTNNKSHNFIGVIEENFIKVLGLDRIPISTVSSIKFTELEIIVIGSDAELCSYKYQIYCAKGRDIEYAMRLIQLNFNCDSNSLFYDEMSETFMINPHFFGGSDECHDMSLTDQDVLKIYTILQTLCNRLDINIILYEPIISKAIQSIAVQNKKNILMERVSNIRWDGKERVFDHAIKHLGIRLPGLDSEEEELQLIRTLMVAWNLGCVYRMFDETKHEIIPFLIGPQGQGKSTYISWIAGGPRFYTSTVKSVNDSQRFLEATHGKSIVELGESSSLRGSDIEKLKNFVSESSEVYRRPYDTYAKPCIFRYILIGTSNKPMLFIDDTGNRRFYPLSCNPDIAMSDINPFDPCNIEDMYEWEQYWAELYLIYKGGGHCWIKSNGPIGKKWAVVVSQFTIQNQVYEFIENYLDEAYPDVGNVFYVNGLFNAIKNEAVTNTGQTYKEIKSAIGYWLDNTRCSWSRLSPDRIRINVDGSIIRTNNAIVRKTVTTDYESIIPPIHISALDTSKFVDLSEVIPWMPVMYNGKVIYYKPDKPFNAEDYDLSDVKEGDKVERITDV